MVNVQGDEPLIAPISEVALRDEAAAGRDRERLVPVALDSCKPPLGFRQYHTLDLSGGIAPGADCLNWDNSIGVKLRRWLE